MAMQGEGYDMEKQVDSETGESVDLETGESFSLVAQPYKLKTYGDSETGERAQRRLVYQRSKFRVPRSALKLQVFETAVLDSSKSANVDTMVYSSLFTFAFLVILPGWATVLYILAEVMYHSWAHCHEFEPQKTPMQLLFENGCAECRSKKQMQKVGELQDKRMLKFQSRRILNYNYAHFGIST